MTSRLTQGLISALFAGLAGGGAYLAWEQPMPAILAAAVGAGLGGVLLGRSDRPANTLGNRPNTAPLVPQVDLQPMLDAVPLGLLIIGQDDTIREANETAKDLFGLNEAKGLPYATLRSRRLLDRIATALLHGTGSTLEFTLTRAGDASLSADVRPLGRNADVLVAIRDETRAQRAMNMHRDFVANASHELKTPLAAVSGIIETLLGHAREDPEASERFLKLLTGQTQRMTRLIEGLLSLNRIELNERVVPDEPQDVLGILAETIDALRPIAEVAGVELTYTAPEQPVTVLADRDELSQLFGNLIDNAIKYGGKGNTITVTATNGNKDDPDTIGILVQDQGPGIAREHLPRLTERFYRVNNKLSRDKGGTGLGLAICKHILNRHRGRLEIESRIETGSRFTIWLPVADPLVDAGSERDQVHDPASVQPQVRPMKIK